MKISTQTICFSLLKWKMEDFSVNLNAMISPGISQIKNRQIIRSYDGDGDGICDTIEVAKWLVDCYRAMNKTFQPTATDIASYVQVIDRNRTGKVSLDDLENFIAKFFYNPNRD